MLMKAAITFLTIMREVVIIVNSKDPMSDGNPRIFINNRMIFLLKNLKILNK
jgi:hypothetical protein